MEGQWVIMIKGCPTAAVGAEETEWRQVEDACETE